MDNLKEFIGSETKNIIGPSRLKKLGNVEFLNCFLASFIKKFNLLETDQKLDQDPRISAHYEELKQHLNLTEEKADTVYEELLSEAESRGLDITKVTEHGAKMYDDETFNEWKDKMERTPTYVREVFDSNYPGDSNIKEWGEEFLDYPVQKACKILIDKGYETYWSSANIKDATSRKGDVVLDKSVAYILIDHQNLDPELKETLLLNGEGNFWDRAIPHNDNGNYYGIWSEITSPDMLCDDLSDRLVKIASNLPGLSSSSK